MKFLSALFLSCLHTALSGPLVYKEEMKLFQCPDGYVMNGPTCTRAKSIEKEAHCPEGSTQQSNGKCIIAEPAKVRCPEGKLLGNLICKSSKTIPGELVCPLGATPHGDKCYVGKSQNVCPAGTIPSPSGGCQKFVAKTFQCPPDTFDDGNSCVQTLYAKPIPQCPKKATMSLGKCIVDVIRESICPPNSSDEGSQCAVHLPPVAACGKGGYALKDNMCVKHMNRPAEETCPDGGVIISKGTCSKNKVGPTSPTCPQGTLIGKDCIAFTSSPAEMKCPSGYNLDEEGRLCLTNIPYDCSEIKDKCEAHTPGTSAALLTHVKGHFTQPVRKLTGKNHMSYCEKVFEYVAKTCNEKRTAVPLPHCDKGHYAGKNMCKLATFTQPTLKCDGEVTHSGECVIVETYPSSLSCQTGSTVSRGSCRYTETHLPFENCPEGTQPDGKACVKFLLKVCPPEGCTTKIFTSPLIVCPDQYAIVRDTRYRKECRQRKYVAKIGKCPTKTNEVDETTCVQSHQSVIHDGKNSVTPQFLCPRGFAVTFGECQKTFYSAAEPFCEADQTLVGEMCSKEVAVVTRCPRNSRMRDGQCWINVTSQPLFLEQPILMQARRANPLSIKNINKSPI